MRINVLGINLPARNRPTIVPNIFSDDFNAILSKSQLTTKNSTTKKWWPENGQKGSDLAIYHSNLAQIHAVRPKTATRAPETDQKLGF